MSNPYMPYREPEERRNKKAETLSSILAALKLGLEGYQVYQTGEINKERNALSAKELEMRGAETVATQDYRKQDLALRGQQIAQGATHNTILQQQANQAGEANRIKTGESPDLKNFGVVSAKVAEKHLTSLGVKQESPVIQNIREMAGNPEVNNGMAYQMMLKQYPEARQEMLDSMAEDYTKKLEKYQKEGKDYSATTEGRSQLKAIEAIETDQTGEAVLSQYFPGTAQSIKAREANSKAALLAERLAASEGMLKERLATSETLQKERLENARTINEATLKSRDEIAAEKNRSSEAIAQARLEAARGIAEGKANKGPTDTEKRNTAKTIADAESTILGKDTRGNANAENPAVQPHIDLFNQYSTKPYAYVWKEKEGTKFLGMTFGGTGGVATKIKLPSIKGKQVTAAEVYYTAEQNGITYDEVLRKIGAIK
jgi:hypothetical protein